MTDKTCVHPLATRPVLYTDTVGGKQTCRDDLWAVTTDELNALAAQGDTRQAAPMTYDEFFAEARRLGCKLPPLDTAATDQPSAGQVDERALHLVQKLSCISMRLAADLVQGADYTFKGHDYLDRNFVCERVMQWRAEWDATYPERNALIEQARASLTPTAPAPETSAAPVELMRVREEMAKGSGFWSSCSGCHDTEDGHPTGPYSYSRVFGCALGSGCSECGGIGAVWDNADYAEMGAEFGKTDAGDANYCALCGGTGGHWAGCSAPACLAAPGAAQTTESKS